MTQGLFFCRRCSGTQSEISLGAATTPPWGTCSSYLVHVSLLSFSGQVHLDMWGGAGGPTDTFLGLGPTYWFFHKRFKAGEGAILGAAYLHSGAFYGVICMGCWYRLRAWQEAARVMPVWGLGSSPCPVTLTPVGTHRPRQFLDTER